MRLESVSIGLIILLGFGEVLAAQSCTRLDSLPVHIVENQGLYPDAVAFFVRGADKTVFFSPDGITYRIQSRSRAWTVKVDFVDANPDVVPCGKDARKAVFSYFRGRPGSWRTGLPSFGRVVYPDLWPGIDLVYRSSVDHLKYEFVVKPGADPSRIRLQYRGATDLGVTPAGALRVETPIAAFEDAPPVAYQTAGDHRIPVEVAFTLDTGTAAFRLGRFDSSRPLVVDPAVVVYCGYIGGKGPDYGNDIAVDASGHAYVTGYTLSDEKSFPVKVGPSTTLTWPTEAFVAKVHKKGTHLIYCGYIGGKSSDNGHGIAVDNSGSAYVTGTTSSSDFPVKIGPGLKFNGGSDAFVAKVNAKGTGLDYAGYIGGAVGESGEGIAVDNKGHAYVAGFTDSDEKSFPVTGGPVLTHGGSNDGFVAKVTPSGSSLVYCGYIGGQNLDRANDVAVDEKGNAYVCGCANSPETTFPVKVGPCLKVAGKYFHDAWVAKVNGTGAMVYCGYIGGTSSDVAFGVAVDKAGAAYVVGHANDTKKNFPVTVGPDLTYNGGWYDAFIAKVNPSGKSLDYCGFIGGDEPDYAGDVAVDSKGNAYVIGQVRSTEKTFPVVGGPDLTYNGGGYDAFVARVDATGKGLDYCGYIGGSGWEWPQGIAVDNTGNVYACGRTESDEKTFPVKAGPDLTYGGSHDAWVAKIAVTHTAGFTGPGAASRILHLVFTASDDAGLQYQAGTSLGTGPFLFDTRPVYLDPDMTLWASVRGFHNHVFVDYAGVIGQDGTASAKIQVPDHPNLHGVKVHTAFITLSSSAPSGVKSISNTWSFTITP